MKKPRSKTTPHPPAKKPPSREPRERLDPAGEMPRLVVKFRDNMFPRARFQDLIPQSPSSFQKLRNFGVSLENKSVNT